ncbi:hypothetical protein K504DRAFT_447672 [Pleomassaria siparia CBS 279.74]|uniref:Uncharacterized protein n=1 Tax=Pleomassaria siparia CBS 279.74 TaxID=1314801 RepID=A0A6G1K216_9PLEO|nr:hypothetical protein K504DRAFT_447672 [Pleomassaria siparia CBS 279.74]
MVAPSTRSNRFSASFSPMRTPGSLRRLRTAFSPVRSGRSVSPSSSMGTTSPLTRTSSPHSHRSTSSFGSHSIRELLRLRRKPSVLDAEMEEEKHLFSHELEMLEPRPSLNGQVEMGIFQVLDGKF